LGTQVLDAPGREIQILRGLYIFQGGLLWVMAVYLFGIRSSSTSYSTGAGLGVLLLVTVLLVLAPLAFFQVARRIVSGGYWGRSLALSVVSAGVGLLIGLPEFSFLGWVRYSPDQGFIGADLGYLASVVGLLVFGATSLTCIYYLLRPTVRAFVQAPREPSTIEEPVIAPRRGGGTVAGVSASVLLWLPVVWVVYVLVAPRTSGPEYLPPIAGGMVLLFLLGSNTVGLLFVGLTKSLLKQSRVFGALFISGGLLNLLLLWSMFGFGSFSGLLGLLIYMPSLVPIIVGVSLIVSLRELVTRQRGV
jgi:hypothetical protein